MECSVEKRHVLTEVGAYGVPRPISRIWREHRDARCSAAGPMRVNIRAPLCVAPWTNVRSGTGVVRDILLEICSTPWRPLGSSPSGPEVSEVVTPVPAVARSRPSRLERSPDALLIFCNMIAI